MARGGLLHQREREREREREGERGYDLSKRVAE